MNWVDILIIVFVVGLAFLGWRNGVIRWVFTLLGGILGVVLAGRLYTQLAPAVPLDSEGLQQVVAFAIIFFGIMIAAWMASRLIKTVLSVLLLGWVDHAAGAALGIVAGALVASAIVSVMGIVPSDATQDAVDESTLAGPLIENTSFALTLLPSEFDAIRDAFSEAGNGGAG